MPPPTNILLAAALLIVPISLWAQPDEPLLGTRSELTVGELFVPDGYAPGEDGVRLVVHLHGAAWAAENNLTRSGENAVLVTVVLPGLSKVYTDQFADPAVFPAILAETKAKLAELGVADVDRFLHVTLTSFSAGFGGVREILKSQESFDRIDTLVMADSIHAGLVEGADPRQANPEHLEQYLRFAKAASAGDKRMLITHSAIIPPTYAATTETADYLIEQIGGDRKAIDQWWGKELRCVSRYNVGSLRIFGFVGDTGPDHMQHLHNIWQYVLRAQGSGERALVVDHPVLNHAYDPAKATEYQAAVENAMAMSEDEWLAFVPDRPFTAYCECPNCFGGVEGNGIFSWSIDRPEEMKCRHCDTVFPNERFPEEHVLEGPNLLGETVSFPYHKTEDEGIACHLSGNLARWRRHWMEAQIVALGKAYQATGDDAYAHRVALALDRIAEVYAHYPLVQNLPRIFRFRDPQTPPYNWDSGRWGYFHNEISKPVINALDLTIDSPAYEALSAERGYSVSDRLVDEFLRPTYEVTALKPDHVNNVVGYDVASAAMLGRVINDPRIVHWAVDWMRENVNAGCFFDGWWHEAPSYHYMTMGGLIIAFRTVKGHSDPAGYVDPIDATRFDDLDPETELPFFAKALNAPASVGWPDGTSSTIHDTHPYEKRAAPRDETVSTIAPGFGHASLGRGAGENQMQAQLHFSGGHGHSHLDNLNLSLWAKEREMLSDVGYTWSQMRTWTSSTIAHNTVVVDRINQAYRNSDCNLLAYFPGVNGVSMVAADGVRGYGNVAGMQDYRRMIATVPVSDSDAYVVDIFVVSGGATHDWTLHGSADHPMTATCTVPLDTDVATMLPDGETWVEPKLEADQYNGYGMLRDMKMGHADGPARVDFAYEEDPTRGVRIHLPHLPDAEPQPLCPRNRRRQQGRRSQGLRLLDASPRRPHSR